MRLSLALFGAVLLVYARVWGHAFMPFDDPAYVLDNLWVRSGISWAGTQWAFTAFHSQNWHPLTWLSHMFDVQLFGLHAGAHLAVSVLLHAVSSVLLFHALRAMTGRVWSSAIVAALFALHPLRVESVAWVAERKDVLSGLFFMLTLLCYDRYTRRPGAAHYLLVAACMALGLMAKSMLVTLPFVLLLLDFWPLSRARLGLSRLLAEKLPLLGLAAGSSALTLAAQREVVSSLSELSFAVRAMNATIAYVEYLWSAVWPLGLTFLYPHPAQLSSDPTSELLAPALASALFLLVLSATALAWRGSRPYLLVGWLWYLGMLVPVIGLVQVGVQARADRYTYLPMIGVAIAIVWGVGEGVRRYRISRELVRGVVLVVLLLYAGLAWRQVGTWQNPVSVFLHSLQVNPKNYAAHNGLGLLLEEHGQLDRARDRYERAIEILPGYADSHTNLGNVFQRQGDLLRAEQEHRLALASNPALADGWSNLGVVLDMQGRTPEAIESLDAAVRINPHHAQARYNLGVLYERGAELAAAEEQYRRAVQIRPDYADAWCSLGIVLGKQEDLAGSREAIEVALAIDPTHAKALFNRGVVLARTGDLLGAIDAFEQMLRIHPDHAPTRQVLSQLREQQAGAAGD